MQVLTWQVRQSLRLCMSYELPGDMWVPLVWGLHSEALDNALVQLDAY